MNKKYLIIILGLLIIGLMVFGFFYRVVISDWWFEYRQEEIPEAVSINNISKKSNSPSLPARVNLDIPFQPQAPHANWEMPYQEACEEASIIMAVKYLQNIKEISAQEMSQEIVDLVEWQNQNFGGHYDLSAEQTVELLEKYYGNDFEAEIIYDFSLNIIKEKLSKGQPIIIPAAGRQLNNPYYQQPGPLYHMLVIKGYTSEIIITNDPGTRRGADYQYDYDTLYNAVHDWNEGDVENGDKVMITIKKL